MTVETVQQMIQSSRTTRGKIQGSTLILLGMSILLGALVADGELASGGIWGWILPQTLIGVLALVLWQKARRQRNSARLMEQALEAVQLQLWPEARHALEQVLRRPIRSTNARAESLLALAAVAEADGAYEIAQTVYESLLQEQSADALQLHGARVALAGVLLRNGQLTDAVNLIERLERAGLPESLRAQVELVALFREVSMGQVEAGVARAEERQKLFRDHLGTRAGYGYGLLALAHDRAGDEQAARHSWHDATLLVRPAQLVAKYKELKATSEKYPPAENPL